MLRVLSSFKTKVSLIIRASRYPFSLKNSMRLSLSPTNSSSIYFDFFQKRSGNFDLVFLSLLLSFLLLKTSFPLKLISLIFMRFPRSTFTTIFLPFFSVVSGMIFKATFVFKKPSFLYLLIM